MRITAQEPKTAARRFQQVLRVAFHLLPILVISALWLSVIRAYRISEVKITDEMVQQARESPPDSVLEELKDFDFMQDRWERTELVDSASQLLGGNLRFQNCSAHIVIPFSARDLDHIPPACELPLAGFYVPDVLLRAYEVSGRQDFLTSAQAFISAAARYEQAAWLPRGQFWNEHALAARVSVLANFWRLYRHSPQYQPGIAREVMQLAAHAEGLLASPSQFTFATNHGIMQNLALWHASLAFPSLPRSQEYQRLATARMKEQMKFYVSEEGVVLEHSAGYQSFGLRLLGWGFRYLDLMHQTAPEEWIEKYDRAEKFYATLRRPDGSLPMFGDTDDETDSLGPHITTFDQDRRSHRLKSQQGWKPAEARNLYPVSAYSVWWDGLEFWPNSQNLAQTVVVWSNFFGHGHKHADEMSVLFWAGGQTWLSNIGYWPYESEWRSTIESWTGSNAPHLVGEGADSIRTTRLVSSGSSGMLTALELERTGVDNYVARRQVIHCKPNLWLVLDNTSGAEGSHTSTTWTSASDVHWQQGQTAGAFRLESPHANNHLDMFFLGSQNTQRSLFRGGLHPFAGWQLEHHAPTPAFALVVEQPTKNSWAATVWTLEKSGAAARFDGAPQMRLWTDAAHWEMQLPGEAEGAALRREGNTLRLNSARGAEEALELTVPPDIGRAEAELRDQFMASASRYDLFSANLKRRKKVTYLLLGIFLLQTIFFAVYKRACGPFLDYLKYLTMIAWIAGGIWLVGFYF